MKGKGVVYILTNNLLAPDLLKIGMSRRSAEIRASEIYKGSTGVPEPFIIAFEEHVENCVIAEELIHKRLGKYRPNDNREFFQIPLDRAKKVITTVVAEVNNLYATPPINKESEKMKYAAYTYYLGRLLEKQRQSLQINYKQYSEYEIRALIRLTVKLNGDLSGIEVLRHSPITAFNDYAIRTIHDAAPFNPLPSSWGFDHVSFYVTVEAIDNNIVLKML